MTHTHATAPTQFVECRGNQFAYRRLGAAEGVPVVFLQHFTGTMDYWDPALVDGFARERPVILFDNTGVGSSSGETPATVREMALDAVAFIDALGLQQVDLLGFSLGGFVAQVLAAKHPHRARRLILAGTGPEGGDGIKDLGAVLAQAQQATPTEPGCICSSIARKTAKGLGEHSSIDRRCGPPLVTQTAPIKRWPRSLPRSSDGAGRLHRRRRLDPGARCSRCSS